MRTVNQKRAGPRRGQTGRGCRSSEGGGIVAKRCAHWCDAVSPTGPVPRCDRSAPVCPDSHCEWRHSQWLYLNPAKRAARGATRSLPAGVIVADVHTLVKRCTGIFYSGRGSPQIAGRHIDWRQFKSTGRGQWHTNERGFRQCHLSDISLERRVTTIFRGNCSCGCSLPNEGSSSAS